MSCCCSFSTLPSLLVRCLLVLLPFCTVPPGLLVRYLLGGWPVSGHVASLVTADLGVAENGGAEDASREVHWVSDGKEFD